MASISRKSSYKFPIIIFRGYIMGDEPIIIEQFFYGFEGVIMGSIMGSQNIMGSDYGSNISDPQVPHFRKQCCHYMGAFVLIEQ